mmetsp:Transcript_2/g.10  ORF Transcript_2/g.10 Transcript_2/m.10 type:complete len:204 (+) Transcript_2:228-839(+)
MPSDRPISPPVNPELKLANASIVTVFVATSMLILQGEPLVAPDASVSPSPGANSTYTSSGFPLIGFRLIRMKDTSAGTSSCIQTAMHAFPWGTPADLRLATARLVNRDAHTLLIAPESAAAFPAGTLAMESCKPAPDIPFRSSTLALLRTIRALSLPKYCCRLRTSGAEGPANSTMSRTLAQGSSRKSMSAESSSDRASSKNS